MDLKGKKLILASASPRRKELLEGLDINFEIDTETSFIEHYDSSVPDHKIPEIMSEGKSNGFHRPLSDNEILLTSDTMVYCGDRIMGKPHSREEAEDMLHFLSGRSHTVITAVTLRSNFRQETFSDATTVHFKPLTDEEIDYFIDKYKPFDKAGAYAVQQWIGYIGITGIEGSIFTVIGLPVHLVYDRLQKFITDPRTGQGL